MINGVFSILSLYFIVTLASSFVFADTCIAPKKEEMLPHAERIRTTQRRFLRATEYINRNQPRLYSSPEFKDMQGFTLKYQGIMSSNKNGSFRRIFLVPPTSVKMDQVKKEYAKLLAELTQLRTDFVPHLYTHIAMISAPAERLDYVNRYKISVDSLFKSTVFNTDDLKIFNCDYTSQPLNALWYLSTALKMIDDYAITIFGCQWMNERAQLTSGKAAPTPLDVQNSLLTAVDKFTPKSIPETKHSPGFESSH